MKIYVNPPRTIKAWEPLTRRNIKDIDDVMESVDRILENVDRFGDKALRQYALEFDGTSVKDIEVSAREIEEAEKAVSPEVKEAIATGIRNIRAFHEAQMPREVKVETMPGVTCVQRAVPIKRVGLYIPGGQAPLFSTVLMLAVPARIAGCESVVLCTPQTHNRPISPEILYAAKECGIEKIYRVGGAQAIGAMAMGTETIGRVDKIFGPGNRYVTYAKQAVSTFVDIDMPAGPSEVMVMADESCNPRFVAADLLSQAEHGPDSQAICVCSTEEIANAVNNQVEELMKALKRKDSIRKSLSHSRIIVFGNTDEMVDFANYYAPEHLIISMNDPWEIAGRITAAGSVFIGNYSPESAGDYASGTNHTLPTNGWARSRSGVNLESFMHKITYQQLTPEGLAGLTPAIVTMATAEGLDAHAMAAKIRLNPEE